MLWRGIDLTGPPKKLVFIQFKYENLLFHLKNMQYVRTLQSRISAHTRFAALALDWDCDSRSVVHYRIVIAELDQEAWSSPVDCVQGVDSQIRAFGHNLWRFRARLQPHLRDA